MPSKLTSAVHLLFIVPGLFTFPAKAQSGFTIYDPQTLNSSLGAECINALTAKFDCVPFVRKFMQLGYRKSLGDKSLTDSVCTSACATSLKSWFDGVSQKCLGMLLNPDGSDLTKFGGYMWAGFNETCVKDPRSKQYCNGTNSIQKPSFTGHFLTFPTDLMLNFTVVDTIAKMPRDELCHICHIRRLAMMQSSRYSIYDAIYKEQLEYVYAQCGKSGPTDVLPPLIPKPPKAVPFCVTGKRYTTTKFDSCESIANATGVSGASIYMGNQEFIRDCHDIEPGLTLCVPLPCRTYYIRQTDTCASIEASLNLDGDLLQRYNSWLTYDCSNLQSATDFYGKIICVSPQGGTFTGTATPPSSTGEPPLLDGYTRNPVPPPAGSTVAAGTTRNCGRWHVVDREETCSMICIRNGITAALFRTVNPSLSEENCTATLVPHTALCVGPTYSWNTTAVMTSSTQVPTASSVSIA